MAEGSSWKVLSRLVPGLIIYCVSCVQKVHRLALEVASMIFEFDMAMVWSSFDVLFSLAAIDTTSPVSCLHPPRPRQLLSPLSTNFR
jgi:hypothetical protein